MKLRKVISGGQTGADQTGVEEAAKMGLETGGTMPKGFRTEAGNRPEWAKRYGLTEHASSDYRGRTRENVKNSDVTLWFGKIGSPGYICTQQACKDYGKPFLALYQLDPKVLAATYEVWNVAGNRESVNKDVVRLVKNFFKVLEC